jgi:hypothetical protein
LEIGKGVGMGKTEFRSVLYDGRGNEETIQNKAGCPLGAMSVLGKLLKGRGGFGHFESREAGSVHWSMVFVNIDKKHYERGFR